MTGEIQTIDSLIKQEAHKAIVACGGNVCQAATLLGVSKTALYRWIKKWAAEELAEVKAS